MAKWNGEILHLCGLSLHKQHSRATHFHHIFGFPAPIQIPFHSQKMNSDPTCVTGLDWTPSCCWDLWQGSHSSLIPPADVSVKCCHLEGFNALLCAEMCSVLSTDPSYSSSCCCWGKFDIFSVFSSCESCHTNPTVLSFTTTPISQLPFCTAISQIPHPLSELKGTYCYNRWFSRVVFTQTAAEIISRVSPSFQKWGTMQSFSNEVH